MTDDPLARYAPLDDNFRDQLVAIGKGAASLIPLIGGPLAEIIGVAVPRQRADRIAAYVRELDTRIQKLAEETRQALAGNAAKIDLIEEGGYQAARAMSEERILQIANAVAGGLDANDIDVLRRRRLLVMLGELDDDEVAILNAYGRTYAGGDRRAFAEIQMPGRAHLGSPPEAHEQQRLYEAGKAHLLRLDLLKRNYGNVKKGELPEFESRIGDFKHRVEIAPLGRLLLKEIGLATPFDEARESRRSTEA
ncbi:hypothetical protein [Novosphingobium sp. fls2-241-R2A-195]|uniref:hypothetical protein n=1 Tax=Novosphingobium sp. fls2-241-R2A-195 TaxID=3040296 RepID=UPI00254ECB8E|nr:hypothetical protein [Novosphingobium sp. fls2-241-R2A-195]